MKRISIFAIAGVALVIGTIVHTEIEKKSSLPHYNCPYNDSLESAIICCLKKHPGDVKGCVKWTFEGLIKDEEIEEKIDRVKKRLLEINHDKKVLNVQEKNKND